MDMSTRQKLAELIQKDIDQLREKAENGGVTAWLARPVQRERPNERFLISTLRSVQAHNRRAEEEEMWERFEQRRQREEETARGRHACGMGGKHRSRSRSRSRSSRDRGRRRSLDGSPLPGKQRRHRSRSGTRSSERRHEGISNTGSSPLSCHGAQEPSDGIGEPGEQLSDEEIAALIASKRSRGRGAVGSRMDMPGPYLPLGSDGEMENEDTAPVRRRQLGPARPDWLQPVPQAAAEQRRRQQEEEEKELIALGDAWRQQQQKSKKQRRSRSSSSSGSGDSGSDSDSSRKARRRKKGRHKRDKKHKKKKRKHKQ